MSDLINNRQPGYAGVNINCYTVDPTKLPPNHPLLTKGTMCEVAPNTNNTPQSCYPSNYYTNNFSQNACTGRTRKRVKHELTNELIKNLEDSLNNPKKDIRDNAAKFMMSLLDEDRTRYNNKSLIALNNKMLQDPNSRFVRDTAMLLLNVEYIQGNDKTKEILKNIELNDKSRRGADAVKAANILTKLSTKTELVDVPVQNNTDSNSLSCEELV